MRRMARRGNFKAESDSEGMRLNEDSPAVKGCDHQHHDNVDYQLDFDYEENRDTSLQTVASSSDKRLQILVEQIRRVDGAGLDLLRNPDDMLKILVKESEKFNYICESYVLGLVSYGSYFPLRPILHDHERIKKETIVIFD
ncbi:unnamed protein product [Sphagnum balticum]